MQENSQPGALMICPHCGHVMNHHADKLLQLSTEDEDSPPHATTIEMYTCPNCGANASRNAV